MSLPWREAEGGLVLAVRLTPKGGRNSIDGIGLDASGQAVLRIRVSAPPVDGAANKALLKFLAKASDVPKSVSSLLRAKLAEPSGFGTPNSPFKNISNSLLMKLVLVRKPPKAFQSSNLECRSI